MVAFVNDKFTNMSAHTSYLYLVKELNHFPVIATGTFRNQSRTETPRQ